MADNAFPGIDQLLGESIKRVAEPGDPAGVAELIRARVAGGDIGTPSKGGEFSGGPGSGWPWLPWAGGALVVAIVGGLVGASGVFGSLAAADPASGGDFVAPSSLSVAHVVSGLDCPGGAPVVGFRPGDRVLAVARSDDSAYLAVRSPFDRADTVWLPVSAVEVDEGQSPVASLEVDGCPDPVVTLLPPVVEPTEPPAPKPPAPKPQPPAPPAPDTTPPTLGTPSGVQSIGCTLGYGSKPEATTISITASDNKAVAGVSISWSGAHSGSGAMTKSGPNWVFSYNPPNHVLGNVEFWMVAYDAAGNQSGGRSFIVNVDCLI